MPTVQRMLIYFLLVIGFIVLLATLIPGIKEWLDGGTPLSEWSIQETIFYSVLMHALIRNGAGK